MAPGVPASYSTPFQPEGLLLDLLAVSLTGINVLRPLYGPTGELADFLFTYINPAAQRMTGQPEQPAGSLRTLYPDTSANGVFDLYRRAFETGEAGLHQVNYQADGLDNYYHVAARRSEEFLLVSFTDTSDQPRSAVEEALRQSQAREQLARAEAEAQRTELQTVFEQAPIALARLRGPAFVVEWANPRMSQIWGRPLDQIVGRPHFEALPDLAGQGFEAVFAGVLQTGEPHYFRELLVTIAQAHHHQSYQGYFNLTYQPAYDEEGRITGLISSAIEVTAQVEARQQMEQLNQELEARVQARTQELAEQQRLLDQILARVPAAITTLSGPDHRFTFANARYQQLTEGRVLVGRTVAETLPEVAEQGFIELLDNVYGNNQTFEGKEIAILLAPPGEPPVQHYLDFTYLPMPDVHGQPQGILVFAVDVTEQVSTRRQAAALQAQLLATAQHQAAERLAFYQIFEQTPALVALLRAPGHRYEYVNPAYQALFPGRQLVGRDAVAAVPELQPQGFIALMDSVYQTGETYFGQETPFEPVSATGEALHTTYFDFTYQAYRENGEIAGISIIAFDITEQVLARQERATQQRQLREVFEQAPVAIFVVRGAEYVFDVVNPSMGIMLGNAPDQVLGQRYFDLLPALAEQGYRDLLDQVWHTGQTYVAQEQAAQLPHHRAGETGYYNFTYVPVRTAEGSITGIMCVAVDVTPQVQARQQVNSLNEELAAINEELTATNEELHQSNSQLTRTNVDLDTFVYTASHDLKAPITNIEGIVLALREILPAAVQEDELVGHLLGLLDTTVARFQFTIGQLTDISRLQLAHVGPAEPVTLAPVVEAVRLDLMSAIAAADTQLTVTVAPDLVVSFSPANLRSIVYNLLSNAIKYRAADRRSQVQLHAERLPHTIQLTVQDNGLGMSALQQRQLFGLFQRLHTHVEGTGVGLYITKRLIENAGGTIAVQSQPGVGTTFTVTFPA